MQSTMDLLSAAEKKASLSDWTKRLELSKNALYNSREREHLSPAIAGRLAEFLSEDVEKWIMIAALESEKDSACKRHLLKRLNGTVKSCF